MFSNFLRSALVVGSVGLLTTACEEYQLHSESTSSDIVYGTDDRQDVYAHPDARLRALAEDSTVALMSASRLDMSNPNNVRLNSTVQLGPSIGLCSGERFFNDTRAAFCSGTLVDDDIIITAGHCVETQAECESTRFVFNFYHEAEGQLKQLTADDVYSCKKLEAQALGQVGNQLLDYAVIRLDRPATPRFTAAPVRVEQAAVTEGAEVAVIGFPTGIPAKIAAGGFVTDNNANALDYFEATVDTFGGNSGSGVYRAGSYDMVGILVRGQTDYVNSGGCEVVNTVCQNECGAEDITYVSAALEDFCEGGQSAALCGGAPAPSCSDGLQNQDETGVDCGGSCPACAPPPTGACIALDQTSSFSNQDGAGSLSPSGCTLGLDGNRWQATSERFTITRSSVLRFSFSSSQQGEIHGIGFDEDDTISPGRIFQVFGTQNWGVTSAGTYTGTGGTQTFEIPVGEFYTGQNMRLVIVNDDDAASSANSVFSNVELVTSATPPTTPPSTPPTTPPSTPPSTPPTNVGGAFGLDFVNSTTGLLYHENNGWTAGFQYLCIDGDCRPGTLVNGRYQREISNLNQGQSYALEFKVQDNTVGQCLSGLQNVTFSSSGASAPSACD